MKELTIQEKARRYDEAIERAKGVIEQNPLMEYLKKGIEYIFPELKESEDEEIRKFLIQMAQNGHGGDRDWWNKCVAWLEKQGEQKPADEVEHLIPQKGMYYTCIKDYYSSDNIHLYVKGNVYKSFFNGYIEDESYLGLSWTNSCTGKYFEPTKDEDWIVCEYDNVIGKPMQYKEFKKKVNQKFIENLKAKGLTPKLRLWNLQDTKDGDVLYAKGSYFKEYLFMFSSFTEDNVISTHFGYDVFHGTFDKMLTRFGREEDFISVAPATKEQCGLLFKKMKEAGYELDAEKKELKKIEPNPWSEEDELRFKQIDFLIRNSYSVKDYYKTLSDWFKSLKDRVQC